MAGDLEQPAVEHRVLVRGAQQVARVEAPTHLLKDRAQLGDVGWGRAERRPPGGQPLEHGPRLEDLDGLARIDEPDARAAVALVDDQAFVLEPGQGGTDGRAPDAEHLRQVHLHEALAGLKAAGDDRLPKPVLGATGLNVG